MSADGDNPDTGFSEEGLFDYVYETLASLVKVSAANLDDPNKDMDVTVKILRKGVPMYFKTHVEIHEEDNKYGQDKWGSNDEDLSNHESFVKTPSAAQKAIKDTIQSFRQWMDGEKRKRLPSFSASTHNAEKIGRRLSKFPEPQKKNIAEEFKQRTLNFLSQDEGQSGDLFANDDDIDEDDFDFASLEIIVEEGVKTAPLKDNSRGNMFGRKSNSRKSNSRKSNARRSVSRLSAKRTKRDDSVDINENEDLRELKQPIYMDKKHSLNTRMLDIYKVGNSVEDENFEFSTDEVLTSKNDDGLLRQKVLNQPLSKRQAHLAAVAGGVMFKKDSNGRFGAAIKRRLKVKQKESKRKQARSPHVGLHIQPRYILLYYIIPLLLLAINNLIPILTEYFNYIAYPDSYEDTETHELPYLIRILIPEAYVDILNRNVRFGRYAFRIGGIYVGLTALYRFWVMINLLRPKPYIKRMSTQITKKKKGKKSEEPKNYRFLLKWQGDAVPDSP